jgi:hypothetical protein
MNLKRVIIIFVICLLPALASAQQTYDMGGVVYDEEGQPLPGANVYLKNTSAGTTTDMSGKFKIKASKGNIIVFSFVGYNEIEYLVEKEEILSPNRNVHFSQIEMYIKSALKIFSSVRHDSAIIHSCTFILRSYYRVIANECFMGTVDIAT